MGLKWIWRLLFYLAGQQFKGGVVRRAKRAGVLAYLKAMEGSREVLIIALLLFFVFHFIVLAGAGALVTGIWLLDVEPQTKLLVLFASFATLFFIPLIILCVALSSRGWYKLT